MGNISKANKMRRKRTNEKENQEKKLSKISSIIKLITFKIYTIMICYTTVWSSNTIVSDLEGKKKNFR